MSENRFLDSVLSAFNPLRLIGKIIIMFLLVSVLALDKLMEYGDKALAENGSVLVAVYLAYKEALYRALGTIFPVLKDFITLNFDLIANQSYFQIGISAFFFLLIMMIVFQPVSLIVNALDFKVGHGTSLAFRILITFFVVLILSAVVFYGLGETGISHIPAINETINSTLINATNGSGNVPTISLV